MPIKNPELLKEARARAEEKRKDTRFRLWEFVAFCDLDKVMPSWKDKLNEVFVDFEVFGSPAHNEDGCKDNTHVLIKSKSLRTKEQIVNLLKLIVPIDKETGSFVGVPDVIPSYPQDTSQRLRYFIHADQEGKRFPQYNPNDFHLIGTADPLKKIKWTSEEQDLYAKEMLEYARECEIQTMQDLREAFADSRIHTYMITQVRVKDQLKDYFSALKEAKNDRKSAYVVQLQEQLLKQAQRTEQLQKQLLAMQLRQYIHVLKVDFTAASAQRAKELGAKFDRHSGYIYYLGKVNHIFDEFDEYVVPEPALEVYEGLDASDKYQLQDKNGWTYTARKKTFS